VLEAFRKLKVKNGKNHFHIIAIYLPTYMSPSAMLANYLSIHFSIVTVTCKYTVILTPG